MAVRKTKTSTEVKSRYNKKVYAQLSVRLNKELVEKFRRILEDRKDSAAGVIREAVERYIDEG